MEFDISWDNSWRVSSGPSNWDAAWVFIKYRIKTQTTWNHATLNWVDGTGSGDGHTEPANSDINSSNDNGAGGAYGVFIHRDADMAQANVSYTGVKLRWNYGVDGLTDANLVEVRVYAMEMVYVPQGSFYAGDGSATIVGQFESVKTGAAKQITSEGALTLGGGGAGSLGNNNAGGMSTADDFNDATSKALPAAFPKGYNAFYCMKYEISQAQYAAFLNTLTYTQQATRTAVAPSSAAKTGALKNPIANRNGIEIKTSGVSTTTPAVYVCNLNNNGTYDEAAADGLAIACNFLSFSDVVAYFDWAALRPMTELEYEKACRGTLAAVANEYAWGSTAISKATGISNSGDTNETASNAGATCVYLNVGAVPGPMRVGNFGQGVNTRAGTGSSYYGIMELSGNLYELLISVGKAGGRSFTGVHGNGAIDATGNADASNWPLTTSAGGGFRGGGWDSASATGVRVSDRFYASDNTNTRLSDGGGRGVRTAP